MGALAAVRSGSARRTVGSVQLTMAQRWKVVYDL